MAKVDTLVLFLMLGGILSVVTIENNVTPVSWECQEVGVVICGGVSDSNWHAALLQKDHG